MLRQIITYLEAAATNMEKIALEFVMQDEQLGFNVCMTGFFKVSLLNAVINRLSAVSDS